MSDDAAKHFEAEQPAEASAPQGKSFTLLITLHPDGKLELTGPLGNDVLCFGMLEKAKAHIAKLHLMKELQSARPPARGGIDGLLKRMNGG